MKVCESLLLYDLGYTVQIKRKGLVIKLGIYNNNKGYYDTYSLHFCCYILPIVLKKHFIFCLLWLYTHYIIDRQISYSILHLHLLSIG